MDDYCHSDRSNHTPPPSIASSSSNDASSTAVGDHLSLGFSEPTAYSRDNPSELEGHTATSPSLEASHTSDPDVHLGGRWLTQPLTTFNDILIPSSRITRRNSWHFDTLTDTAIQVSPRLSSSVPTHNPFLETHVPEANAGNIFDWVAPTGRKVNWKGRQHFEVSLLNPWSDGQACSEPQPSLAPMQQYTHIETPKSWLVALATQWIKRNIYTSQNWPLYILDKLPEHYHIGYILEHPQTGQNPRGVLFGHPNPGSYFNTIDEFWPHFCYMMKWRKHKGCQCDVCNDLRERGNEEY